MRGRANGRPPLHTPEPSQVEWESGSTGLMTAELSIRTYWKKHRLGRSRRGEGIMRVRSRRVPYIECDCRHRPLSRPETLSSWLAIRSAACKPRQTLSPATATLSQCEYRSCCFCLRRRRQSPFRPEGLPAARYRTLTREALVAGLLNSTGLSICPRSGAIIMDY